MTNHVMEPDWTKTGTLPLPPARNLRSPGPRSLAAMSARIVANNISLISPSMLNPLTTSPSIINRIYRDLLPRGLTFHAWKLLSPLLGPPLPTPLQHFTATLTDPQHDLKIYTIPLTSQTGAFLAVLKIDRIRHIQTNELLTLAELPNLSVLEVTEDRFDESAGGNGIGRVTDNLARGWSEKPCAFRALRRLRLWECRELSHRSLRYVTVFPVLVGYSVSGPEERWDGAEGEGRELGWEEQDGELDSLPTEEEAEGSAATVPTASLELVPAPGKVAGRSRVGYSAWPKRFFSRDLKRAQGDSAPSPDGRLGTGPSSRSSTKRQQSSHQTSLRPKKRRNLQDVFSGFGM
ncbi:hypothetical protein B0T19DRAFT_272274 [Cercophora scortea]|uniref:Uncharacterized protein n=1 Tax=Cercophora scortea TaxID=314031 RepID=A0AAE0I7M8_9PEZI|nr:hypothetical protein B0T19DRAFT_272274 [Cercophora scortea]